MDKEDEVYTHNGILLSHKEEWNFAISSDMDGLGRGYAKWKKSNREIKILYDHLYVDSKKYNKVENEKKMQSDRYREQTSGYQFGGNTGGEVVVTSYRA